MPKIMARPAKMQTIIWKLMASGDPQQAAKVWSAILGIVEMTIPRSSYKTWLGKTNALSWAGDELLISVPDAFTAQYIQERLMVVLDTALRDVAGDGFGITLTVEGEKDAILLPEEISKHVEPTSLDTELMEQENNKSATVLQKFNLNYTFGNFIVGDSNELAFAGAKAVSESPGLHFNPLVLYSEVGLGKTHLLHAIAHEGSSRGLICVYTTCEDFTNQYVLAIRNGTTESFRKKYRSADILLIDDIQFLIGKEQTQEGFFHTFNALHMSGKQLVISSDRPVTNLTVLEPRITSRLAGGLVTDIQTPTLETRLAILRSKSSTFDCKIPDEVMEYLAQRVQSNIRELEGSLNKIVALSQFKGTQISLETVKIAMADVRGSSHPKMVNDEAILTAVSNHFGIPKDHLKGKGRRKTTVQGRQVAIYLLRQETDLSLSAIGKILGGRDHSTVLHGYDRVASRIELDDTLRDDVLRIRTNLMKTT